MSISIDGSGSITGIDQGLSVSGVLTFDDVTNVDSVGLVTARSGLHVTGGDVGIGTDSPAYNLDLGESPSTIRLVSENNGTAIRVGAGGDSNDVTLLRVDGTSSGAGGNQGESDVGGLGFSIKYMGSATGNNNSLSIFGDNGVSNGAGSQVEAITVLQDGKIGIGTDNPQGIVHISSGTSGDATLILEADTDNNDESDNPNIIFRQDGGLDLGSIGMNFTNSSSLAPSNELYIAASSTTAAIVFATGTNNNYTNATERVRIESGGNVGIGTDNPDGQLTIRKQILATDTITNSVSHLSLISNLGGSNAHQSVIHFGPRNASTNSSPAAISAIASGNSASDLAFYVNGNNNFSSTPNTEALRITSDGKMGVGTTSPSGKLDVQGTVNFRRSSNVFSQIDGNSAVDLVYTANASQANVTPSHIFKSSTSGATIVERMRIDSSGRLLVGVSSSFADAGKLQLKTQYNASYNQQGIHLRHTAFTADDAANLTFQRSRDNFGGDSAVIDGSMLGQISFSGYDGTDYESIGASISAEVDGTPGTDDMPGALVFGVTKESDAAVTKWMYLRSGGLLTLGLNPSQTPIARHTVASTGGSYAVEEYSGVSPDGLGTRIYYGSANARGKIVTRGTSNITVDIGTPANATGNQAFVIKVKILAVNAVSNDAAEIEFYAQGRASGGTYTYSTVAPVVTKAIVGATIGAGSVAWSGGGNLKTLQYTTSSSSYVKYRFDVEVVGHDFSSFELAA